MSTDYLESSTGGIFMPSLLIYACSNNTENYSIYIIFMYRVLEKPHTHFLRRFFFLNTDNQSSPTVGKGGGGGGGCFFFTVNAVLVARKLEGDQVLINNVFFSLQKDLFCLERELLNNGFTLSYFHRSPSNGASISIKFLSQPFPE